ncbi:hypothetical protein ACFLZB_01865 [Nanoarchaeota archaeon]
MDKEMEKLLAKYKERLKEELGGVKDRRGQPQVVSREYKEFKKSFLTKPMGWYEKGCKVAGKILRIKPSPKKAALFKRNVEICHLEITPTGAMSFAFLFPLLVMVVGALLSFALFQSLFFVFSFVIIGLILIVLFQKLPSFLANSWRMKASNQMVQCIFYVVTYMRHTSNLERAIEFASDHLAPPLSLDLRKVLWDVETHRYGTIKDSLDDYLATWKDWNKEFIEAFHLIESSLFESSEGRRLDMLDKSLSVILTETYEKMLHYAHDLKSPITMLHMMGVILPILGLVILPLVVSFMSSDDLSAGFLVTVMAFLYNILIPVGVFFLGKVILSKRPTGYGESDISEENPELKKYKYILLKFGKKEIKINPLFVALLVFGILFFIGISPVIMHILDPNFDVPFDEEGRFSLLGYVCPGGSLTCDLSEKIGPFGIGASLLSLVLTLSFGVGLGIYYSLRSKNVIKIRARTKKLEDEFASSLFQLGNRLGDGLPAEIAFGKVSEVMQGTTSGGFYSLVSRNISKLGMSVKDAIFSVEVGALVYFPSKVIESSMKVLVESVKKGPKIAAQALVSMSRYIKEIHRVNERLKDLLADIISSMKSQVKFLTPAIAGIVVGITSMITTILTRLGGQISRITEEGGSSSLSGVSGIVNLFGDGVPTYYFQIVVGLYVVQIIYILTVLSNGIENGSDKLNERYSLGKNLLKGTILYCLIAFAVMMMFNLIAGQVMMNSFS